MKVKVNTAGYGGRKIKERVRIETNDPNRPMIDLAVTGMVEKLVEIQPSRIHLAGPAGTPLAAEVEIIPRKDYPLIIEDIKAKDGNFIKYAFTRRCTEGQDRCVIRVENTRADKGRYIDVLFVNTNSTLRPNIPIYIIGTIQ